MVEKCDFATTINRRRFLSTSLASSALLSTVVSAQQPKNQEYSIMQDGKCISITPLYFDGLSVENFYDYRTPETKPSSYQYASFGTENLQRKDTSILFLYEGPKGLSLVMVHGKLGSGNKYKAVTFRITGLPANGKWVMKDDEYDGSTNVDTFDFSTTEKKNGKQSATSTVSWTWRDDRTDGGVFHGLDTNFKLSIHPAFNRNASFWNEEPGDYGEIKKWEILSGDPSNPVRMELDLNKPVTIQSGACSKQMQQSTNETTQDSTTSSKASKSQQTKKVNKRNSPDQRGSEQSFFDSLWKSVTSILNGIVTFFTSLY